MVVKRDPESIPNYPVDINYNSTENSFVARVPDLNYATARGDTPEEALEKLQTSIKETIENTLLNGRKLPEPSINYNY